VRLLAKPEGARPVLFGFDSSEVAGACVADIIGEGIIPVAIEFMDKEAIDICEAFAHAGYPMDVQALLIVEVEGSDDEMDATLKKIIEIARKHNVKRIKESQSAMEAALIWKGRKSAFGATGRVADYICMDGTVPLGQLSHVLRETSSIIDKYGLRVANVFHAGDGNMHPLILYNVNDPAEAEKAGSRRDGDPQALRRCRRLPDRRARRRHREARPDAAPVHRDGPEPADARARRLRSGLAAQPVQGLPARWQERLPTGQPELGADDRTAA
jgi:glycolate oxidase